jgi:transcription-repair coupling factor (superfamily II helicase)
LRWLGEELGFEKINLKGEKFRGYFISTRDEYFNSEVFGKILQYVQGHSRQCKMRDQAGKATLVIENVKSVDSAIELLNQMAGRLSKSLSDTKSK